MIQFAALHSLFMRQRMRGQGQKVVFANHPAFELLTQIPFDAGDILIARQISEFQWIICQIVQFNNRPWVGK